MHLQDKGCTFPECDCKVPDYAFSEHIRKKFCKVVKNEQTSTPPNK